MRPRRVTRTCLSRRWDLLRRWLKLQSSRDQSTRAAFGQHIRALGVEAKVAGDAKTDVYIYLKEELEAIANCFDGLGRDWFTSGELAALSSRADRWLMYAETVARVIGDPLAGDPCDQLRGILKERALSALPAA